MKLNGTSRFPYPVLWSETKDYENARFSVDMEIEESSRTGQLNISYRIDLQEPTLGELLKSGSAAVGLLVTCGDTYYNTLTPLAMPQGVLSIAAGVLRGRVVFRPVIWSLSPLDSFVPAAKHPEYGQGRLTLERASILALGDEWVIDVGNEKLARIESIFSLTKVDSVPADKFDVQLEGEKIQVSASGKTFEQLHKLRGIAWGRTLLLNAVYLPVVMNVLVALREDPALHEGRRWHRIFMAKINHLGISLKGADVLQTAQAIFEAPLGRLVSDASISNL